MFANMYYLPLFSLNSLKASENYNGSILFQVNKLAFIIPFFTILIVEVTFCRHNVNPQAPLI